MVAKKGQIQKPNQSNVIMFLGFQNTKQYEVSYKEIYGPGFF